jgi:acyl carrier protein
MKPPLQKDKIKDKIKDILSNQLGYPKEEIKSNSHLESDLGMDSIDNIEIAIELEKEFNFSLSSEEEEFSTVKNLIKLVKNKTVMENRKEIIEGYFVGDSVILKKETGDSKKLKIPIGTIGTVSEYDTKKTLEGWKVIDLKKMIEVDKTKIYNLNIEEISQIVHSFLDTTIPIEAIAEELNLILKNKNKC